MINQRQFCSNSIIVSERNLEDQTSIDEEKKKQPCDKEENFYKQIDIAEDIQLNPEHNPYAQFLKSEMLIQDGQSKNDEKANEATPPTQQSSELSQKLEKKVSPESLIQKHKSCKI